MQSSDKESGQMEDDQAPKDTGPPENNAATAQEAANCPSCNASNPPDEEFCGNCGTQLSPSEEPADNPATNDPPQEMTEQEREEFKLLTLPKTPIAVSSHGATHIGRVVEYGKDE